MKRLIKLTQQAALCQNVRGALSSRSTSTTAGQELSYDEVQSIRHANLSRAFVTYYKKPLLIQRGQGQWLWDSDGRKYLDMFAGVVTTCLGHCHPRAVDALTQQAKTLWHTTNIYMTPPIHDYARKLTATLPKELSVGPRKVRKLPVNGSFMYTKVCYIVNSGAEANELAVLMARVYTGNYDVVTMRQSYHGLTNMLFGATNMGVWKPPTATGFGFQKAVNADPYRGPWGGANCRDSPSQTDRQCACAAGQCLAKDKYLKQFDETLRCDVPNSGPAAMLVESIQGAAGTIQFPKGFVKGAFERVRARGGICISDEVQTGFGRTGSHFWGFQTHDVVPDIVTMAKGIGNGFPLAAVVCKPEVAGALLKAQHLNTFGGNPLACAVASTVLDVIKDEGLQENALVVGTYLIQGLAELKKESPVIGDVRGKGLMVGVELVENKETREPLAREKAKLYFEQIKDNGVLVGLGGIDVNVLRIKPALCITKENVDQLLEVLRKVLC